jgi:hypothetical protein
MIQHVIAVGHSLVPESLAFDEPGNKVWAVTTNGAIVTVRLLDQQVRLLGFGYRRPIGLVPGHDGLTIAIAERSGRVWLARRDHASRSRAQLLVDLPGRVLAVRRHPDFGRLMVLTNVAVLAGEPNPTIWIVDSGTGVADMLTDGLAHARTFVVDELKRELVVLSVSPNGDRQLTVVNIDTGAITIQVASDVALETIVTSPDPSESAIIGTSAGAATGQLILVRLDGTTGAMMSLAQPIRGLVRWGSLLLAVSGSKIVALEWDLTPGSLAIDAPLAPLYLNGYVRLSVDIASAGLLLQQVLFTVREGSVAGYVSAGLEPLAADGTQPMMLLAGFRPGEYHVEAKLKADGSLLGLCRFRVTACWPDEIFGPPVAVTGPHQTMRLMSWGGAGAGAGYILPAPEVWRVAVVLVATKDRRWGALEGAAKTSWKDKVIGGGDSVKRYYEEVSYRNTATASGAPRTGMTIELAGGRVLGPVDLEEGWGDIFEPKKGSDLSGGWLTKPTGKGILAGAISSWLADQADGAQIMDLADTISIVVRSATDMPTTIGTEPPIPTQYVWGHASTTEFWRKTSTTFTEEPKPMTIMTEAYPAGLAVKPILEHTLCHEIGHNLGLADLYDANNDYPAEINSRSPANADLMASSRPLPHFSIANRMRLGWIKRAWLRRFDFSFAPSGGTVVLQAAESLTQAGPPAGRFAGIEVPINDGWSYLFEYRAAQAGQIGDQSLDQLSAFSSFVLGTDLRISGGESARPPVLFLPTDIDGDGPVLDTAGENYKDSDVTNPVRMHDFGLTLQAKAVPDANSVTVRVDYISAHRPQLQIRPAPGRGDFKSPDIDLIGPFGITIPGAVKDARNTIRVTVHNFGSLAATDVKMHVKWLPFTLSAGSWKDLSDPAPFNVPAVGNTSISIPWDIPASVKVGDDEANHFCVRVEIESYRDPVHPENEEIVVFDNVAQSNFDSYTVPFGSPSDRIRTAATVTNPLNRPATFLFTADQSNDGYRIFLGHAWLRIAPGDTHTLSLAYESLAEDPLYGKLFEQNRERISARANHVALTSWLVPENTECDTPREWWGVGLDLRAGRRAWIKDIRRNGELVTGHVQASRNGKTIVVGSGEIHMAAWPTKGDGAALTTKGMILPDGSFRVLVGSKTMQQIMQGQRVVAVLARPGDAEFAKAISEKVRLD